MRTRESVSATGLWFALVSAATFGVSGPFAKSLLDIGWSPGAAVGVRISGAALVLLIPVLLALRGRWGILRRNWLSLTVYGLTAIALCQFFYFNAVQRMSVGVSLMLEYLAPVLIVGWIWLRTRQAPRKLTLLGAGVAMAGLLLVLDLFSGQILDPVGVLYGLGAALGLAMFFIMSAKVDDDLPPLVMAGGGMVVGAASIGILGLAGIMPFSFELSDVTLAGQQMHWLVPVLSLVLVSAVASYVTGIFAARRLGPKVSSFVALTEVLFAVLASWLMLGELPGLMQLAGGVLIVGGVVLVRLDELRSATPAGATPELVCSNSVEPVPHV